MIAYECYLSVDKLDKRDIVVLSLTLLVAFFMMLIFSLNTYVVCTFIFLILILYMKIVIISIAGHVLIIKGNNM